MLENINTHIMQQDNSSVLLLVSIVYWTVQHDIQQLHKNKKIYVDRDKNTASIHVISWQNLRKYTCNSTYIVTKTPQENMYNSTFYTQFNERYNTLKFVQCGKVICRRMRNSNKHHSFWHCREEEETESEKWWKSEVHEPHSFSHSLEVRFFFFNFSVNTAM